MTDNLKHSGNRHESGREDEEKSSFVVLESFSAQNVKLVLPLSWIKPFSLYNYIWGYLLKL